jgi:hypothetical protein
MNLSAPKQITWVIALIIGVVGILAQLVSSLGLSGIAFWVVVLAWLVLLLATLIEGL